MLHPHSKLVKWLCPKWVAAITLPWGIYFRSSPTKKLLRHELAHWKQIRRDGVLKFYAKYCYEYVRNLWHYRDARLAYMAISYEREARKAETSKTPVNLKVVV